MSIEIEKRIKLLESAQGQAMATDTANTVRTCLENAENALRIYESTDYGSMTGIKNFTMDLISVIVPNLVAEKIVSVQPIKNQVGVINYIQYIYGSDKGAVKAGDVFASALQENNTDMYYSSEEIKDESIAFETDTYKGNAAWLPVIPGTLRINGITDAGQNFTIVDAVKGNIMGMSFENGVNSAESISLVGDKSVTGSTQFAVLDRFTGKVIEGLTATGTLDYKSGAISIKVAGAKVLLEEGELPLIDYRYDQRSVGSGAIGENTLKVPQIETRIVPVPVTARSRKLKALYSFDSLIVMQQEYGTDIRKLVETQVAQEIIHEIDGEIMFDLFQQAGTTQEAWSAANPVGVSKRDHYETLLFHFNQASNKIFGKTKRARGNFVICGLNVASIIEMAINFKPTSVADGVVGPHIIGNLGNLMVIKNPYYGENDYVVGYHGTSLLDAGYVYAPYLPVTTTGTVMMDDFVSRQGWVSIYAKKMLNPNLYVRGSIVM